MAASDGIIKRALEFCSSDKFEHVFDTFARSNALKFLVVRNKERLTMCVDTCGSREHGDTFADAAEAKAGGGAEHKHECECAVLYV